MQDFKTKKKKQRFAKTLQEFQEKVDEYKAENPTQPFIDKGHKNLTKFIKLLNERHCGEDNGND